MPHKPVPLSAVKSQLKYYINWYGVVNREESDEMPHDTVLLSAVKSQIKCHINRYRGQRCRVR